MQEMKIVLTMNCEPSTETSHPAATGPASWGDGENAVLGYIEVAARYGLPVTFSFIRKLPPRKRPSFAS